MRHTLTGVWVEIKPADLIVSRCGSHPHGCVSWNSSHTSVSYNPNGHTLTGVWVEIRFINFGVCFFVSHPHGCVSWNWKVRYTAYPRRKSHPHGCVSWNLVDENNAYSLPSHPHGCVSWNPCSAQWFHVSESHPHGCVSWNVELWSEIENLLSHTLTGVWVEIRVFSMLPFVSRSHPHGCVSWNWTWILSCHDTF